MMLRRGNAFIRGPSSIVPLVLLVGCAVATSRVPAPAAVQDLRPAWTRTFGELSCSSFEWVAYKDISSKAAIRVPVRIAGRDYKFQLDTGAEQSFLYGNEAARHARADEGTDDAAFSQIEVAGTKVPPARLKILNDREAGFGTLGLDLLIDHFVLIDFPGERFCLVPRTKLPQSFHKRISWTRASLHHGKFFVPLKIGNRFTDGVFFDTGASIFPLSTDAALWRDLTGAADYGQASTAIKVPSWGKELTFVGARSKAPLEIAGVRVEQPLVYTNTDDPSFFRKRIGGGAQGLFGNSPLLEKVVILDLTSRVRFGILQGPAKAD